MAEEGWYGIRILKISYSFAVKRLVVLAKRCIFAHKNIERYDKRMD